MESTPSMLCALAHRLAQTWLDEEQWALFSAALDGGVTRLRDVAGG